MARGDYKRKKSRKSTPRSGNKTRVSARPRSRPVRSSRLLLLALFLLGTLLYVQTLGFDYAYDDKLVITRNDFTKQGLAGIPKILSTDLLVGFFGEQRNLLTGGRYRPLSLVTYAVEWEFFGRNPGISHLINAILYGLTGVALYLVLVRILSRRSGDGLAAAMPLVATLIFLVHPLHSEVVANIKGRDELMSMLGALVTLLLVLKYLDSERVRDQVLALTVYFFALLAKESAFTFLAVIPLTAYFFTPYRGRQVLRAMVPVVVAAVVWLGIRHAVIGSIQLDPTPQLLNDPFVGATSGQKFATVFYTMALYLKLLVVPHPLTSDYYPLHIPIIGWADLRSLLSLAIHLALAAFALWGFRKKHVLSYAILVYLITFFPFSNLLFPIGTFMNERFMYAPSIGFSIAAAFLLARLSARGLFERRVALVLLGVCLVAFTAKTLLRTPAWKDDFTLFTTDVNTSPNSAKANMSAGAALYGRATTLPTIEEKQPLIEQGVVYLRQAIRLHPTYLQPRDLLALSHAQVEDYEATIAAYEDCLEVGGHASRTVVGCWDGIERMGDLCESNGLRDLALRAYSAMLRLDDNLPRVHAKIGRLYGKAFGNRQASLQHLTRARELDPDNPEVLRDLGVAYGVSGDHERAIQTFLRALELKPDDVQLLRNLSAAYRSTGDVENAERYRARAQELSARPGS